MSQSPAFDVRLQKLKEGDPTVQEAIPQSSFHQVNKITKKLCIVWDSGRRMFFHYAHLMTVDLDPELGCLTLEFATRRVVLKGYRMDLLYERFVLDEPYVIYVPEQRYASLLWDEGFFVTGAIIE